MNDKVKKLLKGAGYSDEIITSVDKDDFDAQQAVEANHEAQKEHYKSLLENEIKETIRDEALQTTEGKIYRMLHHELKKYGVPIAEVEAVPLKDKIKIAADHFKAEAEKVSGKSNEDFKQLQEEFLKAKNQLAEKEDWLPKTEIEKEREKLLSERKAEKVDVSLQKQFNSIPAQKLLGNKHSEGFYLALKNVISSKYDTDIENDQVVFYEKGTRKKVTGKSEGKEDFLKASDVLTQELKALNFWVESNGSGGQGQPDPTGKGGSEGEKKRSARFIEMQKEIEAAKQAS